MEVDLPQRLFFDWKKVLYYALPLVLILGLIVVKIGSRKGRAEADFVAATNAFLKWDQVLEKKGEDLASLQKLMKKHPELHAYYDPQIGQNFLAIHQAEEAAPYIERTLKRTQQPFYSDYAQTSLKISGGKYAEALKEAYALKENLLKEESFWRNGKEDSSLFAFNLMRIATLCQELGDYQGELAAWKEIKLYGGWDKDVSTDEKIGQAGFKQLLSHFTVQETTLLDYIQAREEDISKQ